MKTMSSHAQDLLVYCIQNKPPTYPNSYVAVRWKIKHNGAVELDRRFLLATDNIMVLRTQMQHLGLSCIPRDADDDPTILEVWL